MKKHVCVMAAMLVAGCSGGGGSPAASAPAPAPVQPISLLGQGGLWTGTLTVNDNARTQHPLLGIVAPAGSDLNGMAKFWMPISDGSPISAGVVVFNDLGATGGQDFASTVAVFANTSGMVPNNLTTDTGSVQGTVDGSQISGNYSLTNSGQSGIFALDYDSTYRSAAALKDVAGTYSFQYLDANGTQTVSLRVSRTGNISDTVADTAGCSYSGSLSPLDSSHDIFSAALTQNCPRKAKVAMSGLAAYFPATNTMTPQLEIIVDDGVSMGLAGMASQ